MNKTKNQKLRKNPALAVFWRANDINYVFIVKEVSV